MSEMVSSASGGDCVVRREFSPAQGV